METKKLLLLAGDGIGCEVIGEAKRVLEYLIKTRKIPIQIEEREYGISAWKGEGKILPDSTFKAAQKADAILFGAVGGGPEYDEIPLEERQSSDLLFIRKALGLYANLRPIKPFPALVNSTPYKPDQVRNVDLIIVRELNGGIYFGEPKGLTNLSEGMQIGVDTQAYTTGEIHRISRVAFELARTRGKRVVSADKANVLATGRLWRSEVQKLRDRDFKDIALTHMYADNCAYQLTMAPSQFDVILTDNLLGDILSDCAASIMGSLGMVPSAALNLSNGPNPLHALYEPVHGSAPDIAGKGIANPIATILSAAMALRHSFQCPKEAHLIEMAVDSALTRGHRTKDLVRAGEKFVTTRGMGDAIITAIES